MHVLLQVLAGTEPQPQPDGRVFNQYSWPRTPPCCVYVYWRGGVFVVTLAAPTVQRRPSHVFLTKK